MKHAVHTFCQTNSDDFAAANAFEDYRRQVVRGGCMLFRTDPADGQVRYFAGSNGVWKSLPDIEAVKELRDALRATEESHQTKLPRSRLGQPLDTK